MVPLERKSGAKRAGQSLGGVNHVAGQGKENFLLHVTDSRANEKWLVDGGALISIVPPTAHQMAIGPTGDQLRAANGSPISCYGSVFRTLSIGGKDFPFEFTVAAVSQRIIGADFLANFYLAPNHRDAELLNLKDYSTLPAQHATGVKSNPINFISQADDPCYKLLDSFPEILKPSFTLKDPSHGVKHYIPTSGRPVQSRARRLDIDKLRVAKEELGKLEALGICYKGRSEWASPLMVTTKPCGGWRVCGDYRRLNAITTDDQYPVRQLTDFTSELAGKSIFSKIDLLKGYHQIPVADEDVGKTAVITPFGLYIFPRCPFGLKNAGQDFQRLMDEILGDLPRVFVYIDDILVASENMEQHLQDLEVVFKTLSANGMVVQRPKCVLGKTSLEFLGYQVDTTGISPLKDRVTAIDQTKPPTSVKELQRFLGMVNYYRRFIPKAASHLFHLFEALKGKPKTLAWDENCQKSFDATKKALADATLLHHPRPGARLALTTDASNQAIGGVLEQLGSKGWEPLAFWSAKLEPNQMQWPAYDRELLAAFKGTRHFRSWIEGRPFTLYTDHQSLVPSIHKKTDPQTLRQTYQLSCVAEFTTDIRYVEGKANVVADALSRPNEEFPVISSISQAATSPRQEELSTTACLDSLNSLPRLNDSTSGQSSQVESSRVESSRIESTANRAASAAAAAEKKESALNDLNCVIAAVGDLGLNWEEIATQQALDPEFRALRNDARTGLSLKSIDIGNKSLVVDFSNGPARPYIPYASRRKVFECFHGLGHPGVERTRKMIAEKVVWPSMRQDVTRWARECLPCQQAKVTKHVIPPIGDFEVPDRRFQHVNIDIVTLPRSNGFSYLLTAVDRFTRWPVAVPMEDMTAQSVVDSFSHGWIQHFGVPATVTSDNGVQFTSEIFKQLTAIWGIKTQTTSPYHPEANGMVERFHRRLKESLIALGNEDPEDWYWRLPCSMLAIRTTLKPDLGASPADLVYGEGLAVPGELLQGSPAVESQLVRQREAALADMRIHVSRLQPVQTSAHRRPVIQLPEELQTCTHVFVRRPGYPTSLAAPYTGPYKVLERSELNFKLAMPGRAHEVIHISRLKPACYAVEDPEEEVSTARQQPPPPPQQPPRPRRRGRHHPRTRSWHQDQEQQQQPPPQSPPPSPPIHRHVPRGRARQLQSDDEDEQPRVAPPDADPFQFAADYDVPVDEVPEWQPPDWFDQGADEHAEPEDLQQPRREHPADEDAIPEAWGDIPPPPPSPPAPPQPRRKQGNPNWVKGGSMAGSCWKKGDRSTSQPIIRPSNQPTGQPSVSRRPTRARPDVSAILTHLGLTARSVPSEPHHDCSPSCEEKNLYD